MKNLIYLVPGLGIVKAVLVLCERPPYLGCLDNEAIDRRI